MRHAQRYACSTRGCEESKVLPESPTDGPVRVRTGCEACMDITLHVAEGRVPVVIDGP